MALYRKFNYYRKFQYVVAKIRKDMPKNHILTLQWSMEQVVLDFCKMVRTVGWKKHNFIASNLLSFPFHFLKNQAA